LTQKRTRNANCRKKIKPFLSGIFPDFLKNAGKKTKKKNGIKNGVKWKKNRIRPFPFFKISVFFPFFVRFFLKKINNKKRIAFLKNGKKTEKKRKFKKKLKFEKRIRPFPFFEICVFFPAIFRQFSGNFPAIFRFSKTQSVFCYLFFLKKNGQKTEKKRKF